jgi:hypothetical protein
MVHFAHASVPFITKREEGVVERGEPKGTRVLVAFGRTHRAYGGTIAVALRAAFPGAELRAADSGALGEELAAFGPLVVVSDAPEPEGSGASAWVRLAIEPTEESEVRVGGEERRAVNLGLADLARVVEEAAARRDGRP